MSSFSCLFCVCEANATTQSVYAIDSDSDLCEYLNVLNFHVFAKCMTTKSRFYDYN